MGPKSITAIKILEEVYEKVVEPLFEKSVFIRNSDILAVSDYSGDRRDDNYNGYAFLLTNKKNAASFIIDMINFRKSQSHLPDNSYFEYKKVFQDDLRRRLLPEVLRITDQLEGILLVIYIQKSFDLLGQSKKGIMNSDYSNIGLEDWKPNIVKKMIETFVLLGFFLSKMEANNKHFFWLGDRDSRIGENTIRQEQSRKILILIFNMFKVNFREVNLLIQNKHNPDEYLNSIVDLAAGSLLDVIDNQEKSRNISVDYLKWFSESNGALKKVSIEITFNEGRIKIIELKFKNNHE